MRRVGSATLVHARCCACRGKLLNVREASATQVAGNAEITHIKQILGLQHGKVRGMPPPAVQLLPLVLPHAFPSTGVLQVFGEG